MLGHPSAVLGITQPEIYKMQAEGIFKRIAIRLHQEGLKINPNYSPFDSR